ncbi:DegT/DnrJ/EryC1/StrS family aminotransferase [Stigmatella sp. ncwal1]|uniref:DegT/DnrJ/EryC1/StrS family aminotransferase n=1 Tax=Stigmatella ashevillensis TaxID=2995309 RepID=A0ABT5D130_9BACT|nr:DegT/DnrJ/EryC1/StrS family aminotransferase [Stigmatella ashevillena]MDC0707374.1 DegT/DnrJ/EryC1/StrS family aminotransferase [Stigmatella ashevillena]
MEEVRSSQKLFVPSLPTLWPSMLTARKDSSTFQPFCAPNVRYFYFARNAVWLTVKMLGLDKGEVLVPAYHHGVEIEALVDAGATPRFYRVGARWDVDLEDVAKKITPKTKALYLIHYAGFPGPAAEMRKLADQHGLPLIEDCALSLLSADGAVPLGTTGDVGIFCLYKTLPVPNGGALTINGPRQYSLPEPPSPPLLSTFSHTVSALLQNLELRGGGVGRGLRSLIRGLGRGTVKAANIERVATGTQHFNRAHVDLGMSPLTKRIALSQDLEHIVEARRRNYFFLLGRLRDLSPPLFNQLPPGVSPLFYPLVVPNKAEVLERLRARGIDVIDFWKRFHPACDAAEFPEVAQLRRSIVEIPCHQDLTSEVMAEVAGAVREVLTSDRGNRKRTG